jgi:ATP-dependent DNA ligase
MPLNRRKAEPAPAIDPADWRPQAFGSGNHRSLADPIYEPKWSGVRVLARISRGSDGSPAATLTDEDGLDATEEFAELARALGAAALADELVLDGYLTIEPTQETVGVETTVMEPPTQGQVFAQMIGGGRMRPREPERRLDTDRPIAFVAVDLMLIDGSSLIDLPLLERKRLLDGAIEVGNLVRITPFVRPPIGSLTVTWHALGFRELAVKPGNGRYVPTGKPSDWAIAPITPR